MIAMPPFRDDQPLRTGITVLEASAGTGKTFQIAQLVLRLVAERGIAMRELLAVTFTEAATAELRARIRRRLNDAERALDGVAPAPDPALAAFVARSGEDRQLWSRRLRVAAESFDEACISTIHGFCQRMLQQNALSTGEDFGLELITDLNPLGARLADELLARELHGISSDRLAFLREDCHFERRRGQYGDPLAQFASRCLGEPELPMRPTDEELDWPLLEGHHKTLGGFDAELDAICERVQLPSAALRRWVNAPFDPRENPPPPELRSLARRAQNRRRFPDELKDALRSLAGLRPLLAGLTRAKLARSLRGAQEAHLQVRRQRGFQHLLRSLARGLEPAASAETKAQLRRAIGGRFRAALIDEFQDTDQQQWTIFQSLMADDEHYLYLIGDPKQAIYGFRGANVHVYQAARREARERAAGSERVFTLGLNFRSDARLVLALGALLDQPGIFGSQGPDGIHYLPVEAQVQRDRLRPPGGFAAPNAAALQIRLFDASIEPSLARRSHRRAPKSRLRGALASRVAEDIVALLQSGTLIEDEAGGSQEPSWRPVAPGDIAILVRNGSQARELRAALDEAQVPAVMPGAESVLAAPESLWILRWLQALTSAEPEAAARSAALSPLFGWTATQLLAADRGEANALQAWLAWQRSIEGWRQELEDRGFFVAFRRAMSDCGVAGRLLSMPSGERRLTNLRHAAELIHAAATRDSLGSNSLAAWLEAARHEELASEDEAELRLERDDDAVRILSMHRSKGLQFPIVFLSHLWYPRTPPRDDELALLVPDPARGLRERILDLGVDLDSEPKASHIAIARREQVEEEMRLLYVALTRARHRCILYTGFTKDIDRSPLAVLFHAEGLPEGQDRIEFARSRASRIGREAMRSDLDAVAARSFCSRDGLASVSVSDCEPPRGTSWRSGEPPGNPGALALRRFRRAPFDPTWRRSSYSWIVRQMDETLSREGPLDPLAREGQDHDELVPSTQASAPSTGTSGEEVPFAAFPGGPDAGSCLHELLETIDFELAQDTDATALRLLQDPLAELLPRYGLPQEPWSERLPELMLPVLRSAIGGPLGDTRLADIPASRRLNELRFELPIAGGAEHGKAGAPKALSGSRLLAILTSPEAAGGLRPEYLAALRGRWAPSLAGYLSGIIDLVTRLPTPDGERWFVFDYKSNRIDPEGNGRLPIGRYDQAGMLREMERHHYSLQVHFYALALHRYLQGRLGTGYDYERDFGGVYNLFLRGMLGEQAPPSLEGRRHGSLFMRPSYALIETLSKAFDGRASEAEEPLPGTAKA